MEPSDALAVQVASLRKLYGSLVAVDDVSFEVERGSVFCIIGPNGAGKTTAIECLEGLHRQDSGSVLVAGLDPIADRAWLVHKIGVQLQEIGIPPAYESAGGATPVRRALPDVHSPVRTERGVGARWDSFQAVWLAFGRPETARQHSARSCGRWDCTLAPHGTARSDCPYQRRIVCPGSRTSRSERR